MMTLKLFYTTLTPIQPTRLNPFGTCIFNMTHTLHQKQQSSLFFPQTGMSYMNQLTLQCSLDIVTINNPLTFVSFLLILTLVYLGFPLPLGQVIGFPPSDLVSVAQVYSTRAHTTQGKILPFFSTIVGTISIFSLMHSFITLSNVYPSNATLSFLLYEFYSFVGRLGIYHPTLSFTQH